MGSLTWLLAAASLLLAGCASATSDEAPASPAAVATFDADTGAIEGTVTDDALSPIAGADVGLDDGSTAITGPDGQFVFSHVSPGPHLLHAARLGYEGRSLKVDVLAGEKATASLVLVPLAVEEPYVWVQSKAGAVMCSAWVGVHATGDLPGAIGACVTIDQFRTRWELPALKGMQGLVLETTWQSTQVAGNGLEIYVPFDGRNYLINTHGTDPIRANRTYDEIAAFVSRGDRDIEDCEAKPCAMEVWHYVYGETLGSGAPADAGVLLQQAYTDYTSLFFFQEPAPDYTALADS